MSTNQLKYDISKERLEQILKDLRRYGGTPAADQTIKEDAAATIEALIDSIDRLRA